MAARVVGDDHAERRVRPASDARRDALVPVYQALDLEWDPGTSGSIAAELGRDVTVDEAIEALVAELGAAYDLEEADVDDETMALARSQS